MQNYNLVVSRREPSTINVDLNSIPQNEMDAIARTLLFSVDKAFKDPKVVVEFEQWKKEREAKIAALQASKTL